MRFRRGGRVKDWAPRCSDAQCQTGPYNSSRKAPSGRRKKKKKTKSGKHWRAWALSRWMMMSLARQTDKEEQAQTGSWWVHFWIFWIWNIYVIKVSYFSFEEFENKIVGFGHCKPSLSTDTGATMSRAAMSRVLFEDGAGDHSMWSLLCDWHSSKVPQMMWRVVLSQEQFSMFSTNTLAITSPMVPRIDTRAFSSLSIILKTKLWKIIAFHAYWWQLQSTAVLFCGFIFIIK